MSEEKRTPGIYIGEYTLSDSIVPVSTAIPVFIGYTEKAQKDGKSLSMKPTRISSIRRI